MHAVVVRVIFMLCVSLWAEAARWMWLAGRLYEHVKGCGLCALSAHYWPTVGAHHNGCPIRCPAVLVPPAHINTLSCSTGVVVVVVCLCQHSCSAGCGCVGVLLVCPWTLCACVSLWYRPLTQLAGHGQPVQLVAVYESTLSCLLAHAEWGCCAPCLCVLRMSSSAPTSLAALGV